MSTPRTFKVDKPHMKGDDVRDWQRELTRRFNHWGVGFPLEADGDYGVGTRNATATVLHGLGIAQSAMAKGVTPNLRIKVRNSKLTETERKRYDDRKEWRKGLAAKHRNGGTAAVLARIHTHANGFSGGHDGADLMTTKRAQAYAISPCEVVRVSDDWWGIANPGGALGDQGDGIVIVRATVDMGPHIKKGDYFGYGHGENPDVRVGEHLNAGDRVCDAGNANGFHLHFMQFRGNPGSAGGGGPKGVGNRDPWPAVEWCIRHAHS